MKIGDLTPDFAFRNHKDEDLSFSDLYANGFVVVFFYPKNNTPICTKEACSFRDSYDEFLALGASVLGVSEDSSSSHQEFASKHELPFHLATDEDASIRNVFGVKKRLGLFPDRATFIVDNKGIVREIIRANFSADVHVDDSLTKLKELQNN